MAQPRHYLAHYPDARFDLIELDGAPIGRLYVQRTSDEIRVIDIALLPECRGRGLGGALLQGILDEAGATGRPVRLHVERWNPAQRLYRRLAFIECGEGDGIYTPMEWAPAQVKMAS